VDLTQIVFAVIQNVIVQKNNFRSLLDKIVSYRGDEGKIKELLIAGSVILLFLILSIWQGKKADKGSRNCLIGLCLSILSPFGIAVGIGGWQYGLLCILLGCISTTLFIIGLVLVIKNRKYIRDWVDN